MNRNTEAIEYLNGLVSKLQAGIISYDMKGFITLINQKAIEHLGISGTVHELVNTSILEHIGVVELYEMVEKCLTRKRTKFHLSNILYDNKYLIIDGVKLLDGMLISISDVTADVKAKDRATQSLLLGIETERRRLAKEIHDGIGPNMSTIKLQIDAVKRNITDKKAIEGLNRINESISDVASEIRQISHALMPNSLIDFGVVTALSNYANKLNHTENIEVVYEANIKDGYLSKEHELNIFRIVQELVNNALKYGLCSKISIILEETENILTITVKDNGQGMDKEKISSGIGLNNINTRVESLQGSFTLETKIGQGVTAYVELPIKEYSHQSSADK